MKATLEFDLSEESERHRIAVFSGELYSCLHEIDHQCRSWLKHGHDKTPEFVMEWVRERCWEALSRIDD